MTDDKTVFDPGATAAEGDKTKYEGGETAYEGGAPTQPDGLSMAEAALSDAAGRAEAPASIPSIAKGETILNTYKVESDAIEGGMGAVWRVRHTGWNADLAMKRPKAELFQTQKQKENFIDECDAWINLGLHPNIVSCYYVRVIDGVPSIFSEWMDGGSLKDAIEKGTLYAGTETDQKERILDIAIQFARGLHYAHNSKGSDGKGLIHQDVKPDNLLLTKEGDAKVADFGIAKARATLTVLEGDPTMKENADGTIFSASGGYTPAYCSMEQMDGKMLSRRTDIYSWGVSVMEMYCGKRDWANGVVAGLSCETYLADTRVPVSPELRALLVKCMASEPDDRPHDFAQIESELHEIYRAEIGRDYPRPTPHALNTTDGLNNRALSMLDLGKPDEAELCWQRVLESNPLHPDASVNFALYRWRTGKNSDKTTLEMLEKFSSVLDAAALGEVRTQYYRERGSAETTIAYPAPVAARGVSSPYLDVYDSALDGDCLSLLAEGKAANGKPYLTVLRFDVATGKLLDMYPCADQTPGIPMFAIGGEWARLSRDGARLFIGRNGHNGNAKTVLWDVPRQTKLAECAFDPSAGDCMDGAYFAAREYHADLRAYAFSIRRLSDGGEVAKLWNTKNEIGFLSGHKIMAETEHGDRFCYDIASDTRTPLSCPPPPEVLCGQESVGDAHVNSPAPWSGNIAANGYSRLFYQAKQDRSGCGGTLLVHEALAGRTLQTLTVPRMPCVRTETEHIVKSALFEHAPNIFIDRAHDRLVVCAQLGRMQPAGWYVMPLPKPSADARRMDYRLSRPDLSGAAVYAKLVKRFWTAAQAGDVCAMLETYRQVQSATHISDRSGEVLRTMDKAMDDALTDGYRLSLADGFRAAAKRGDTPAMLEAYKTALAAQQIKPRFGETLSMMNAALSPLCRKTRLAGLRRPENASKPPRCAAAKNCKKPALFAVIERESLTRYLYLAQEPEKIEGFEEAFRKRKAEQPWRLRKDFYEDYAPNKLVAIDCNPVGKAVARREYEADTDSPDIRYALADRTGRFVLLYEQTGRLALESGQERRETRVLLDLDSGARSEFAKDAPVNEHDFPYDSRPYPASGIRGIPNGRRTSEYSVVSGEPDTLALFDGDGHCVREVPIRVPGYTLASYRDMSLYSTEYPDMQCGGRDRRLYLTYGARKSDAREVKPKQLLLEYNPVGEAFRTLAYGLFSASKAPPEYLFLPDGRFMLRKADGPRWLLFDLSLGRCVWSCPYFRFDGDEGDSFDRFTADGCYALTDKGQRILALDWEYETCSDGVRTKPEEPASR